MILVTSIEEVKAPAMAILQSWMTSEQAEEEFQREANTFRIRGTAHFCDDEGYSHFFMTQAAIDRINLTDTHPLPDFEGKAHYAWALLNGCCDTETQAEFDALALVPIETTRDSYRDTFFLNR